jgi:hypothetical protein
MGLIERLSFIAKILSSKVERLGFGLFADETFV